MKYFSPERIFYFKEAYRHLRKYKGRVILIIIFSFSASIFDGVSIGTVIPLLQSFIGDSAGALPEFPIFSGVQQSLLQGDKADIILKLLVFAGIMIILKSVFTYLQGVVKSMVTHFIRRDLQDELFTAVTKSSFSYYGRMNSGQLMGSISEYTKGITGFYLTLLTLFAVVSRIIVFGVMLFLISWQFTLAAIAVELLILPFIKKIYAKIKQTGLRASEAVANLHTRMVELFGNIRLAKIFTTEEYERNRFHAASTKLAQWYYRFGRLESLVGPVTEVTIMFGMIIIFIVAIKVIKIDILALLPFIVAYLYIFMRVYVQVNALLKGFATIFHNIEPYKAYRKILDEAESEIMEHGNKKIKKFSDSITFSEVSFSYGAEQVLKGIDLKVKKGSFTALVGPSGVGKTTVANLIAGLLVPSSGKVLIDSIETRQLEPQSWRRRIGYISQEVAVFNDTVRNNILYGSFEAGDKAMKQAAQIAQLDEFIESLPDGYDTQVGERGAKLSGGQRQRIAIARAIIHDPDVLILDEATSSLDVETEQQIQAALERAMKGRTVIAIAHRLSTIQRADNILVFDKGKVVEQGRHEELVKKSGPYKRYYELQFAGVK